MEVKPMELGLNAHKGERLLSCAYWFGLQITEKRRKKRIGAASETVS